MNARQYMTLGWLVALALLAGCSTTGHEKVWESASPVELRSYQTRAFDTFDRMQMLRTVIATLQDLGFVIDQADATIGSVGATRLDGYELRLTVTVRPREDALLVRANAQWEQAAIEEPGFYQDFFASLEKALFLASHQVD